LSVSDDDLLREEFLFLRQINWAGDGDSIGMESSGRDECRNAEMVRKFREHDVTLLEFSY
jgi:hypothetical protein